MRKFQFLLITLTTVLAFSSCKKDEAGDFFSCKVDGEKFDVKGLYSYATDIAGNMNIYGITDEGNGEIMYIAVPLNAAPGTYQFSAAQPAYYVPNNSQTFSTNWGASSGSVTVEEYTDTRVKGTFSFVAYDADTEAVKKTITDGKFDVTIR
jgi:hypothetical protein